MAFPRERECVARPEGHVEVGRAKTAVGGLERNFESGVSGPELAPGGATDDLAVIK